MIENAKKQEISMTLQLNDLDSKTRNRITESHIGMEKKIEKLQGENDLLKIKDFEKDNKPPSSSTHIPHIKSITIYNSITL